MALQHPQRQTGARRSFPTAIQPEVTSSDKIIEKAIVNEPEEYVLFSPGRFSGLREDDTSAHASERPTLSDFGSLETAALSKKNALSNDSPCGDEQAEDLDSLDDGLGAFDEDTVRSQLEPPLHSSETVLPTHNGLGLFPGSSSPVQERLLQHEQHNPQRRAGLPLYPALHSRQGSSGGGVQALTKHERYQRIEKWRIEQSQSVLAMTQKVARRRKRPRGHRNATTSSETPLDFATRNFIQRLMGVDDDTLFLVFGETSLPVDSQRASTSRHRADAAINTPSTSIFSQIAKQLGSLVQRISGHVTLTGVQSWTQETMPYAGLPPSSRFE
ncbi:MAG: hypothetical protein M1828_003447 [Chrysothrix sp. TS-e1954]|nr:MAG: hypothetical protein M1828_003447 [Chrysothrix sp. TS-e1954]